MALVKGTNCGFITTSPSVDPDASAQGTQDGYQAASKFTSPAGNNKVTEIGWYQDSTSNDAAEYSCGIYSHDAGDNEPNALIATQSTGQSTTANTDAWYKYTGLNISISESTTYWIATGQEGVSGANRLDRESDAGEQRDYKTAEAGPNYLSDPWGDSSGAGGYLNAYYAKYESVVTDLIINIIDTINFDENIAIDETGMIVAINDSVSVIENLTGNMSLFGISVIDSFDIAESVDTPDLPLPASVNDPLSIDESISSFMNLGDVAIIDTMAIDENVGTPNLPVIANINDLLSFAENIDKPDLPLPASVNDLLNIRDEQWDNTDCVIALAFNSWSKGNGTSDKNSGNMPSYPNNPYTSVIQSCGVGEGYLYNNGDGYFEMVDGGERVNMGDITELNSVQKFTVEIWLTPDTIDLSHMLLRKLKDADGYIQIEFHSSGNFYISVTNITYLQGYFDSSTKFSAGELYHVVVIVDLTQFTDANRMKLYINDELITLTYGGTAPSNTADMSSIDTFLGRDGSGTLDGRVYWFALYSDALSTLRVSANYKLGKDMGMYGNNTDDNMVLTNSIRADIPLPSINISDAVQLNEILGTPDVPMLPVVTDNAVVAEIINMLLSISGNISDTMTISEFVSLLINIKATAIDTINLSEFISLIQTIQAAVIDTITINEDITLDLSLIGDLDIDINDSVAVNEFIAASLGIDINAVDVLGLTELVSLILSAQMGEVSDTISITEFIMALLSINTDIIDTITVNEYANVNLSEIANLTASISDSVGISEIVSLLIDIKPNISDTVTISEILNVLQDINIGVFEQLTIVEYINIIKSIIADVSDNISIMEYANVSILIAGAINYIFPRDGIHSRVFEGSAK